MAFHTYLFQLRFFLTSTLVIYHQPLPTNLCEAEDLAIVHNGGDSILRTKNRRLRHFVLCELLCERT